MALKSPTRDFISQTEFHAFAIKIDFRGIADNFNAISVPNLQSEMQKAGSTHGTGSFFRVIFNFSVRKIFPAALADAAFHSPTAGATCFFVIEKFL